MPRTVHEYLQGKVLKEKSLGSLPSKEEMDYLAREYTGIDLESPPLQSFLKEFHVTLEREIGLNADQAILDIGCGRGYFLEFLRNVGYSKLFGIDPCTPLVKNTVFEGVKNGSFQNHLFDAESMDLVITCHTLHHLQNRYPLEEIREMARISRRYVAIAEINNNNLPMFLVSFANKRVEANAMYYNRNHSAKLLAQAGLKVVYQADMRSGYISGETWIHKLAARIGAPPYNIVIAEKI